MLDYLHASLYLHVARILPAKLLEQEGKSQGQNAGIIGANLSKICLIVKGKLAPPICLFPVATQIQKD